MDYNNPLGIEYRVVKDAQRKGESVRIVSGTRTYDTQIEDLWDALTNIERIPRWFSAISGDLVLGGRYQLKGNAGGEIQRCDPPSALDLTWEYAENISWVTVRLDSVEEGTRLKLEHIMSKDEASETHWKKYGPGATGVGWDLGFLGLGLHLQSGGEAVNEEEYNSWAASDEGKSFLKDCASSWGDAHVSNGESPATASDLAENTAKAYCGEE